MIISRTPFRISFFGGGTDYESWYSKHGGAVLSTTINHFSYISARWRPPFFDGKTRVVWNKIEEVAHHSDILHPSVLACLKHLNIENGIEIHHSGDLPARSGLGSSSSFTVGLLHALKTLRGNSPCKFWLANDAIEIERDILKENVGIQDQIAAAYGGLNLVNIQKDGNFDVKPVITERKQELEDHCLLFFTGISRIASNIAIEQIQTQKTGSKDTEMHRMLALVDEAMSILSSDTNIAWFGELLHESWLLKRGMASNISPQFVDNIYNRGRVAGAIGGKLLGAGGGGFMLFFARPEDHDRIRTELKEFMWVPFKFETEGSKIIFNDPNSYSRESIKRRDYAHS